MSHMEDRLRRVYGKEGEVQSQGWIHKKYSTDPLQQLKHSMAPSKELSPNRAKQMMEHQTMTCRASQLIRESVEECIVDMCGRVNLDRKMAHFEESWERAIEEFYEEHGAKLIEAMLEMADEGELVGYEGFINRKALKKRLKEVAKREE